MATHCQELIVLEHDCSERITPKSCIVSKTEKQGRAMIDAAYQHFERLDIILSNVPPSVGGTAPETSENNWDQSNNVSEN